MNKHTSGPWVIGDKQGGWAEIHIKQAGYEYLLPGICKVSPGPNQLANARLIAAAPELLRALNLVPLALAPSQALRDWWENIGKPAIAKAEGTTLNH